MLKIIEKTKIWFSISLIIIAIGMFSFFTRGLEYGIDFKGGTVVEINIGENFNKEDVDKMIHKYSSDFQSNKVNESSIQIKSATLTNENVSSLVKDIKEKYKKSSLASQENIGASVGKETRAKAVQAVIIATIAILIYVGVRFEFSFGVAAIISLVHDVFIMLAIYSILRIPVDSSFIAAILTVIGYSIHDTIVVFDRVRENGKYMRKTDIAKLANASITQTLARSINTVVTVLITLTALYIYVPSVRYFSEPLLIGVISGCYSSIFIACPVMVIIKNKIKSKNSKIKTA